MVNVNLLILTFYLYKIYLMLTKPSTISHEYLCVLNEKNLEKESNKRNLLSLNESKFLFIKI